MDLPSVDSIVVPGGAVWRIMGQQAVLVSVREGRLHLLNEVGTRIWQLIQEKRKVGEIVGQIRKEFDVPGETAEADVRSFIAELVKQKICLLEQTNPDNG